MTKLRKLAPVHPGVILSEEFLKPLGLSQNALARELKIPLRRVNEIAQGKRGVSADTALRLAHYLGTSAEFWLGLQTDYELDVARDRAEADIRREVKAGPWAGKSSESYAANVSTNQPADGMGYCMMRREDNMGSQTNQEDAESKGLGDNEQEWQPQPDPEKIDSMMAIVQGYLAHPLSLRLARRACYDFLAYQNILKIKPTFKQAEAQLGRLRNKMTGLLGEFAKVNPVVLRDLDEALYSSSEETFLLSPFLEILEKLSLLAEDPEPWLDIPTNGVRPTNKTFLRNSFIRTMATAYEKEKLTPALDDVHSDNSHDNQWGNFYELIWGCLAEAGHSPESGIDLENAIRKKLKDRTPRISPWSA